MAGARDGWKRLRSGQVVWGGIRPGEKCLGTDPKRLPTEVDAPEVSEADLSEVIASTVEVTTQAIGEWRFDVADEVLRHAVHQGVAPSVLLLSFSDQLVEAGDRGGAVGADVPLHLPADPSQVGEGPPVDGGPAADDQLDSTVEGQGGQRKPRKRGTS